MGGDDTRRARAAGLHPLSAERQTVAALTSFGGTRRDGQRDAATLRFGGFRRRAESLYGGGVQAAERQAHAEGGGTGRPLQQRPPRPAGVCDERRGTAGV